MKHLFILLFIYAILTNLISPFLTFLHELGHASFALAFTKDKVEIRIGSFVNKNISFKIGRLEVYLNKFSPWVGWTYWNDIPQEKYKKILLCLGGPIASIFTVLIFLFLTWITENKYLKVFWSAFVFGGSYQFLSTIIPTTYKKGSYKGKKSDGSKLIKIIKEKNGL